MSHFYKNGSLYALSILRYSSLAFYESPVSGIAFVSTFIPVASSKKRSYLTRAVNSSQLELLPYCLYQKRKRAHRACRPLFNLFQRFSLSIPLCFLLPFRAPKSPCLLSWLTWQLALAQPQLRTTHRGSPCCCLTCSTWKLCARLVTRRRSR